MQTETVLAGRMIPLHELSERVLSSFHQTALYHTGLAPAVSEHRRCHDLLTRYCETRQF